MSARQPELHPYGRTIAVFSTVGFATWVASGIALYNHHVYNADGAITIDLAIAAATVTLAGVVVWATSRIEQNASTATRPIITTTPIVKAWTGVTGRTYGSVPMQKPRADTTAYRSETSTAEQSAVRADASELSLARVRRIGKWVSNAAPTR